jgi:hypothetical protein
MIFQSIGIEFEEFYVWMNDVNASIPVSSLNFLPHPSVITSIKILAGA